MVEGAVRNDCRLSLTKKSKNIRAWNNYGRYEVGIL